jgi:hypothetical protein
VYIKFNKFKKRIIKLIKLNIVGGTKMIRAENIKAILASIKRGTTMSVSDIQNLVASQWPLSADDWEPHTKTRPTKYPKWIDRTQSVLKEYKEKGLIIHDPLNATYTFIGNLC